MGMFSKLFGSAINNAAKEIVNSIKNQSANTSDNTQPADYSANNQETTLQAGKSGNSWGPVMPQEENQFNYKGTYKEYFNDIFRSEFSSYNIEVSDSNNGRSTVFVFMDGDTKALVVELLSQKSSVYKLRSHCEREKIPYLRYYYDHHGWWNTRSYVTERTRKALAK